MRLDIVMLFKDGVGSVCVKGGEEKGEEVNQENIQEEDGDLNIKKKRKKRKNERIQTKQLLRKAFSRRLHVFNKPRIL